MNTNTEMATNMKTETVEKAHRDIEFWVLDNDSLLIEEHPDLPQSVETIDEMQALLRERGLVRTVVGTSRIVGVYHLEHSSEDGFFWFPDGEYDLKARDGASRFEFEILEEGDE